MGCNKDTPVLVSVQSDLGALEAQLRRMSPSSTLEKPFDEILEERKEYEGDTDVPDTISFSNPYSYNASTSEDVLWSRLFM